MDKVNENQVLMKQIANNTADKAMLSDSPNATLNAIFDSQDAYQEITKQLLSDPKRLNQFTRFSVDTKVKAYE